MEMILAWAIFAAAQCMNVENPDSTCFMNQGPDGIVAQVCMSNSQWAPVDQDPSDVKIVFKGKMGTLVVLPHHRCQII